MTKKVEIKAKTKKAKPQNIVAAVIKKITPIKKEQIADEVVTYTPEVQILRFLKKSNSDIFIKINGVLGETGLSLGAIKVLLDDLKNKGLIAIQNNYRVLGNVSHSGKHDLSNVVVKAIITDKGWLSLQS